MRFRIVVFGFLLLFAFVVPNSGAQGGSTFVVNRSGDEPDLDLTDNVCDVSFVEPEHQCTLRAAIEQALRVGVDHDLIAFNLPSPAVIRPGAPLPELYAPVTIDGTTQPNYAGTPLVELDGSLSGSAYGLKLIGGARGSTIKGLAIHSFPGDGILLLGASDVKILGNFIGTDASGTADRGNADDGVSIAPNSLEGGAIPSQGNVIGGTAAADRNVISGNGRYGVALGGVGVNANRVEGNFIGTDKNGTAALGNGTSGVIVTGGAADNVIGGSNSAAASGGCAGACNLIAASQTGVWITNGATRTRVEGNFIGTDVSGANSLGHSIVGVEIEDAASNTIGATTAGSGNVISGNQAGVLIEGAAATGNTIAGNYVGTRANGVEALGNTLGGVEIRNGAENNLVGGRNVISGN
ncbi:MAG TPA: hypothetical protein VER55_07540, partial [Ardenticatenaceae bacterium]|nr:hypothetical protein [Ardenticatenaceae bacterium]